MVTVFFRGGLGNQMFQYAAGLSLARKYNTGLLLDVVHVNDRFPRSNFTFRTFDLPEVFKNVDPNFTKLSSLSSQIVIPGVWLGLDLMLMNVMEATGKEKILYEDEMKGFDPSIFKKADEAQRGNSNLSIILYGRFENEKYFKGIESELRKTFHFRHQLEGDALWLAEEIQKTNSISLHVRRGDFAQSKAVASVTGAVGVEYYERAIEYAAGKVSDPHFFIFSDDIAWSKKHIPMKHKATYAEPASSGPKAAFHLELMSRCKHNIIANSTFSWWGAWLNANSGKIVVAPEKWYSDGRPGSNIIPESWIKL